MAIEFNKFNNNYNNYNFAIGQKKAKNAEALKQAEEANKTAKAETEFKGLKDETDLLTKNTQYLYNVNLGKFTAEDRELADTTNAILKSLGYDYKVSATQVASVTAGLNNVVMPGMKTAERGAIEANIKDPNGPFAELFA